VFVQVTKSRRGAKVYHTYLVRESFRTAQGPRSRTVCNITDLPAPVRQLIAEALGGQRFVAAENLALRQALDYGGLAVLVDAWRIGASTASSPASARRGSVPCSRP
jgi:hypothetical protein